jgi:hypothetical protein
MSNTGSGAPSSSTGHVSTETLDRFRRRQLAPAELVAMAKHLHECSLCASGSVTDEADHVRAALGNSPADAAFVHIAPDQLIAYVDGDLDAADRELVDAHLDECAMCKAEMLDL